LISTLGTGRHAESIIAATDPLEKVALTSWTDQLTGFESLVPPGDIGGDIHRTLYNTLY
jgi:hypothetical protein